MSPIHFACNTHYCSHIRGHSVIPKAVLVFIAGDVGDFGDLMRERLAQFVLVLSVFLCCLWHCCRVPSSDPSDLL